MESGVPEAMKPFFNNIWEGPVNDDEPVCLCQPPQRIGGVANLNEQLATNGGTPIDVRITYKHSRCDNCPKVTVDNIRLHIMSATEHLPQCDLYTEEDRGTYIDHEDCGCNLLQPARFERHGSYNNWVDLRSVVQDVVMHLRPCESCGVQIAKPAAVAARHVPYECDRCRFEGYMMEGAEGPGDVCAICQDTLGYKGVKKTKCGHRFHLPCFYEAMQTKTQCPLCRAELFG